MEQPLLDMLSKASFKKSQDSQNEELLKYLKCYKKCQCRQNSYYLICFISLGIFYLLCLQFPKLKLTCKYQKSTKENADYIAITDNKNRFEIVQTKNVRVSKIAISGKVRSGVIKIFRYKDFRFFYNEDTSEYEQIYFNSNMKFSELKKFQYLQLDEQQFRDKIKVFGKCELKIQSPRVLELLFSEVLNPFHIFIIFAYVIYMTKQYQVYANLIILVAVLSILYNCYQTLKCYATIQNLANRRQLVKVRRNQREITINSENIVPGDVLFLTQGEMLPCDVVLIQGFAICDESKLNGYSRPFYKEKIPYDLKPEVFYQYGLHRNYTIYAGSLITQAQKDSLGVVITTGFQTKIGHLIRKFIRPKPSKLKFYEKGVKFLLCLFALAILSISFTIPLFYYQDANLINVLSRSLQIITEIVNPIIPLTISLGITFGISRLKSKHQITSVSPNKINVASKTQLFVFDKTGTMTQLGSDVYGVLSATYWQQLKDPADLDQNDEVEKYLFQNLASCHSINFDQETPSGEITDLKIFQSTQCEIQKIEGEGFLIKSKNQP